MRGLVPAVGIAAGDDLGVALAHEALHDLFGGRFVTHGKLVAELGFEAVAMADNIEGEDEGIARAVGNFARLEHPHIERHGGMSALDDLDGDGAVAVGEFAGDAFEAVAGVAHGRK